MLGNMRLLILHHLSRNIELATENTNELSEFIPVIGNRRPLSTQVMEELERLIQQKKIKPDEQLPSEEALTKMLGVSRSTVREALGQLETNGLIYKRHGIGTFVTHPVGKGFHGGLERIEPFRDIARRAGKVSQIVERRVSQILPNEELASVIDIEDDSKLIKIEIIEAIDGVRTMYLVDYIKDVFGDLDKLSQWGGSVITYLVKEVKPPLTHTRTEIFAVGADDIVASKLHITEGKPIQYQVETYYAGNGNVMGIGYLYILTDYFHFFVNRRVS
jgi:GntR family transcriptional regulator